MYKIKRFSRLIFNEAMFADISKARNILDNKKHVFFNHLVLYLLLEEWREKDEDGLTWHWYKELSQFIDQVIEGYDNKTIKKNFSFIKLFEGFIDGPERTRYELKLKEKINSENNKPNSYRNVAYPFQFLNSNEFSMILTELSNYWDKWVKKSGKPKLGRLDNYKDCQSFIGDSLAEVKSKYRNILNKYINMYVK